MMRKLFKIILILIIVAMAVGERLFWDLGPNVELVTAATIISAIYLGRNWALTVPLLILGLTDMFMGNSQIMIFTWSAFLIEGVFVYILSKKIKYLKQSFVKKIFLSFGFGIGASLWFYIWTNFGVWFQGSWGMYPKTLEGLILCFIAGLPFFKLNLIGNILFIPILVLNWEFLKSQKILRQKAVSKTNAILVH